MCMGAGGVGLALFAIGDPLWEGGRPFGGMDPQKQSVGCLHSASKFKTHSFFFSTFIFGTERDRACSDSQWDLTSGMF